MHAMPRLAMQVRYIDAIKHKGHKRKVHLLQTKVPADMLPQAVMQLVVDPTLATPQLEPAAEAGAAGKLQLPPAPLPAVRGSITAVPDPLLGLFGSPGGSSNDSSRSRGGASKLLRELLKDALARFEVTTSLAAGQPDSGSEGRQVQLPLRVSPNIDWGTVEVAFLAGEHFMEAAASAAGALPPVAANGSGVGRQAAAAAAGGSLLDLLHLSAVQQQQQQGRLNGYGSASQPAAASVLHFRQLVVENTSSDAVWLLGGIAAPSYPHTLAAVDDARLFWLEGEWPGSWGSQARKGVLQ